MLGFLSGKRTLFTALLSVVPCAEACGGRVETEAESVRSRDGVHDPNEDPIASDGNGRRADDSPPQEPPAQPTRQDDCSCLPGEALSIVLFAENGEQMRFSRPPTPNLAPNTMTCPTPDSPAGFQASCDPATFSLGACSDEGSCIELGFSGDLLVLNHWQDEGQSVRAITSRNWVLDKFSAGGVVSGAFQINDATGPTTSGVFTVCDLRGSVLVASTLDCEK